MATTTTECSKLSDEKGSAWAFMLPFCHFDEYPACQGMRLFQKAVRTAAACPYMLMLQLWNSGNCAGADMMGNC